MRPLSPPGQTQSAPCSTNLAANGDFGYAVTDVTGSFVLNHLPAYIWFSPTTSDIADNPLVSITLDAGDVSLSGRITFTDGRLTEPEGGSSAVTLTLGTSGFEVPAESAADQVYAAMVVYPADLTGKQVTVTYRFADNRYIREIKEGIKLTSGSTLRIQTDLTEADLTTNVFFSTDDGTTWEPEIPSAFTRLNVKTEEGDVVTADHHAQIAAGMAAGAELDFSEADNHSEVFGVYYRSKSTLKSIVLPKNIKAFEGQNTSTAAFYNCTQLESVTLPEGFEVIGGYSFHTTPKLKTIHFPATLTAIGQYAFYNSGLEHISVPEGVETIDRYSFYGNSQLETVILPQTLHAIGDQAFRGCSRLNTLNLPHALTELGSGVFMGCTALESIEIPASVLSIADGTWNSGMFYGCTNLRKVVLHEGLTHIGTSAFYNCPLEEVNLPSTVRSLGDWSFYDVCKTAEKVYMNAATVGNYAFWTTQGASVLQTLSFGPELQSLGTNAFLNSSRLEKIIFEAPVCPALTTAGAFSGAGTQVNASDRKIFVPEGALQSYRDNTVIQSLFTLGYTIEEGDGQDDAEILSDGVYFSETGQDGSWNNDFTDFTSAFSGKYIYVKTVGSELLTESQIKAIDSYVSARGILTVVDMSEAEYHSTASPADLFYSNQQIFEVSMPWNIETIGRQTAAYCKNLRALILGENVQIIGDYTGSPDFSESHWTAIICKASTPPVLKTDNSGYGWPFQKYFGTPAPCYVPVSSVNAYKTDNVWTNIYPSSVNILSLDELTDYFWRSDL